MTDSTISMGSTGAGVKKAQQALICRGYEWYLGPWKDDGVFGAFTKDAVKAYQTHRNSILGSWDFSFPLIVDGIVGPATWSRLAPPQVKNGSNGNAVRLLQEILTRRASWSQPTYHPGPMDGSFGPLTESAVRAFQEDNWECDFTTHLAVDGIVGPQTWGALWS